MNFSFIKGIFSRSIEIIRHPREEWKQIKEEKIPLFRLMTGFLLPLVGMAMVTSMIGEYARISGTAIDQQIIILRGLREFVILMISVSLSIIVVNAMIKTYGGTKNIQVAANLVIFSFVPLLLIAILLGLSAWLYILGLFALYLFYIFFQGTPIMLDIPPARQSNFSTLASMMILVIYMITSFVVLNIFKSFY